MRAELEADSHDWTQLAGRRAVGGKRAGCGREGQGREGLVPRSPTPAAAGVWSSLPGERPLTPQTVRRPRFDMKISLETMKRVGWRG